MNDLTGQIGSPSLRTEKLNTDMNTQDDPVHAATDIYVDRLSTDLWWDIAQRLSLADLKNLRLSCRWFEDQIFECFIRRAYCNLSIRLSATQKTRLSLSAVTNSPQIAAAVHFLTIAMAFPRHSGRDLLPDLLQDGTFPAAVSSPDAVDLLLSLPSVRSLTLHGFKSALPVGIPSGRIGVLTAAGGIRIERLGLGYATVQSVELLALLLALTPTLRNVEMHSLELHNGTWTDICNGMRDLAVERFRLNNPSYPGLPPIPVKFARLSRCWRSVKGIQAVTLVEDTAAMHGALAVQEGLQQMMRILDEQ